MIKLSSVVTTVVLASVVVLTGCTNAQERTAGGAALGAGAGAVISGVAGGNMATGALVGGLVGGGVGAATAK